MNAYAKPLEALGDPTRRAVFESLRRGSKSVGQIAERMPVSRPAVSQHLKVLKDAGLVTERPDGARRLYSIDPAGLAELRDYVQSFWSVALDSFASAARAQAKKAQTKARKGRKTR